MSDIMNELGLDLTTNPAEVAVEAAVEGVPVAEGTAINVTNEQVAEVEKQKRLEVNLGEIVVADEFEDLLPSQRGSGLGGERESKYKFDDLPAPVQVGEAPNTSWKYKPFTVTLQPGEDEERLKRAVQSATTAANKKVDGKKFVTRQVFTDGKFTAIKVYRIDATLD